MWQSLTTKLSTWWDNTKAFFKRSETIFYARLQVFAGFFLAVFQGIDWSTVTVNIENAKQSMYIAMGLIVNGILTEVLRRRNATDLAPATISATIK